jgi:short subunit dehydrogenase-like uncharacterized protein
MSSEQDRGLDGVLFGATGFVGGLTAKYLAGHAPTEARIGLAGRSEKRLVAVRDGLGARASDWPLLVADTRDAKSMEELAAAARLVVTTVGPYGRYGLPLVAACASAGTSYADLTGELLFVREVIDRFDAEASANGARLVHACGWDSVPSDLGVFLVAERARADGAGELEDTTLVVTAMKGGPSGGTLESMRLQLELLERDPSLRRVLSDRYALSPDREAEPDLGRQPDAPGVTRDVDLGGWIGPSVFAQFNTRVVRRSNALQGWSYGRGFRYREVVGYGSSPVAAVKAAGMTAGLGAVLAGMRAGPIREAIFRALPSPGEGPSEEKRRRGHFRVEIHARTTAGAKYVGVVAAHRDPGYGGTALMLGEAGLCLALETDKLPARAGVLTPATAMGSALVERLRGAGFELSVECVEAVRQAG